MSNDKGTVVGGLDREVPRHLDVAICGAAGNWRVRQKSPGRGGDRSGMARSLLAVAVAASLFTQAAVAQESAPEEAEASADAVVPGDSDTTATQLETVQVTGTRIKGGSVPSDRKSTRLNSSHVKISYAV